MRLIDKLREVAGYTPPICHYEKGNTGPVYCKPFEKFQGLMLMAAVALENAEPVRHATWVYDSFTEYRCSNCNSPAPQYGYKKTYVAKTNYCPNCGKPMDGGESDEG